MENKIPCVYMRGGTSKACFFRKEDLPANEADCDKALLRIFGSPDPKQIDGMGGTYTTTSKAAIISKSDREDADIDYDFRQIGIDQPTVGKNMNCGNISSAVGPYAIDEGMVEVQEPITTVRIYNKNTDKLIYSHVPVANGKAITEGNYEIAGVPGKAARIDLEFFDPQGSSTGKVLPSGKAAEKIEIEGKSYDYSFIDAANPIVFIRLEQFGVNPLILPNDFDALPNIKEIRRKIEIIRGTCAVTAGLAKDLEDAATNSPNLPKIVAFSPAASYCGSDGRQIDKDENDMIGRFITVNGKMGPAFAVTAGICTGVAANIPGTLVADLLAEKTGQARKIRIGHPCGIMDIQVSLDDAGAVRSCSIGRTARRIMDGYVYF